MSTDNSSTSTLFLGFIIALLMIPLTVALNGWALSILWSWFVVPIFGLPALSLASALGLSIVVSFMTHQDVDCEQPDRSMSATWSRVVAITVGRPLLALLMGWIILKFV